ncbi:MAG: cupin domain-containing protein [Sedimentisphaerales bacterium]|nr:cupin domain-containing protein [Sedimentisphaerales bacterium]
MKIEKSINIKKTPVLMEGAKDIEIRVLISKADGANNFAMRMFEVQPGGHTPLHAHPHEHEVFIVEGIGTFHCEGKDYHFEPEHVIFVPGNSMHNFQNTGDSLLRFLCLVPASAA